MFERRFGWIALGLSAVVGLVCAFVPGFDVLNYFSSLAAALVLAPLAGLVALSETRARRPERVRTAFLRGARVAAALALVPLVILSANALFVQNCDYSAGLFFYLMGPTLSMLFASQVGVLCALVNRRHWVAYGSFVLVLLLWFGADLWHLYHEPPIFAYSAFVGFFSGAIYDDVITIEAPFVALRAANLLQLGVLWTVAGGLYDATRGTLAWGAVRTISVRAWTVLGAWVVGLAAIQGASGPLGYEVSRETIVKTLGGKISDARITLYYDRALIDADEAAKILEDHRYRLHALERRLGDRFPGQISSFVYGSRTLKRQLMGARDTLIAKPWLNEIHLNRPRYGDPVLHHELAHVFLGQYADNILRVPTIWPLVPHIGLVEGAAEAMEWWAGELTPHEWTAAMQRIGVAPPLAALMRPTSFWGLAASQAYTVAGSFLRWLLDTYGPEKFKRLYETGDLEGSYGLDFETLEGRWSQMLAGLTLPAHTEDRARFQFDRPGVLARVCPLVIPRIESDARTLSAAGRREEALARYEEVLGFMPKSPRKRLGIIATLSRMGRFADTRGARDAMAGLEGVSPVALAMANVWVGDAAWRAGERVQALAIFKGLFNAPVTENVRRMIHVKATLLTNPQLEPLLGPYLLGEPDAEASSYLVDVLTDHPNDALVNYLVGRRFFLDGDDEDASRVLARTLTLLGPMKGRLAKLLIRETWRLLAQSAFRLRDLDRAAAATREVHARATRRSERGMATELLARIAWLKERKARISGQIDGPDAQ